MPKPVVRDAGAVASKWVRRAANAAQDYGDGAAKTSKSQSGNARAQKALFVAQITAPATHERWDKGLQRSGDEGWRMGVREKGVARYPGGVTAAEAKFGGRIAGILSAIGGVEIPVRGLPASPQNFQRSALIGQALNKLKGTFAR